MWLLILLVIIFIVIVFVMGYYAADSSKKESRGRHTHRKRPHKERYSCNRIESEGLEGYDAEDDGFGVPSSVEEFASIRCKDHGLFNCTVCNKENETSNIAFLSSPAPF